jgi:hypothetical protein
MAEAAGLGALSPIGEPGVRLTDALQTLDSIQARFEVERT